MTSGSEILIKSSEGLGVLRLGPRRGDYMGVRLDVEAMKAESEVFLYNDNQALLSFFEDVCSNWQGSQGAKAWASVEGDLRLSCELDKMGYVFLRIELANRNALSPWTAHLTLKTDLSDLQGAILSARTMLR